MASFHCIALYSKLTPAQGTRGCTNKITLDTGLSFKQMQPFVTNKYFVLWNHCRPEFPDSSYFPHTLNSKYLVD